MVIKIKNANYAAKAIRVIDIPIEPEAETLAYAAVIPTAYAEMDDTQKKALNTFIRGMKTNGIWAKVSHLYLPLFGQSEGGVNVKEPAAANIGFPASGATATYDEKGIKFLLGWATPFSKDLTDVHTGFFNTTARADVDTLCAGIAKNVNEWNVGRRVLTGKNAGVLLNASLLRPNIPNHLTSIGPIIACSKLTANTTSVLVDSEYASVSQSFDPVDPNTSTFVLGGTAAGQNTSAHGTSMGLFTFGSYLTQTEMSLYGALQTTLMTALMAA